MHARVDVGDAQHKAVVFGVVPYRRDVDGGIHGLHRLLGGVVVRLVKEVDDGLFVVDGGLVGYEAHLAGLLEIHGHALVVEEAAGDCDGLGTDVEGALARCSPFHGAVDDGAVGEDIDGAGGVLLAVVGILVHHQDALAGGHGVGGRLGEVGGAGEERSLTLGGGNLEGAAVHAGGNQGHEIQVGGAGGSVIVVARCKGQHDNQRHERAE